MGKYSIMSSQTFSLATDDSSDTADHNQTPLPSLNHVREDTLGEGECSNCVELQHCSIQLQFCVKYYRSLGGPSVVDKDIDLQCGRERISTESVGASSERVRSFQRPWQ